jgi:hypothetical protein
MREDIFQNRSRPLKHVIVPITKHTKAFIRQGRISHLIGARLEMLASVYFDNGLPIKADEIENVSLKWDLPAKFEACQTAMAQQPPHRRFSIGRIVPQSLRVATITLRDWTVVEPSRH